MFEHSVRVPRLYKTATDILKKVKENKGGLKQLVYEKKFQNIKAIYALIVTTLKYAKELDFLLKKTQLLEKENRLDPALARILISELLWGKKTLPGESKPIKTILSYQQILKAHMSDVSIEEPKVEKVLKPRYVRVNTILTTVNEVVEGFRDEGWTFVRFMDTSDYDGFLSKVSNLGPEEFMVDIHIKELLIFPPNTQFYRHDAYKNGLIILQDKSSCLPVHLLDPQPGSIVLDMCAAPGMKTSQIAAKINNEGKVFAVDKDVTRLEVLNQLMAKSSITCVSSINKDVLQVTNEDCPGVEYILVDPSCSGTGIVDRMDFTEGNANNDDYRVKKLAGFQIMILKHAVRKFPKAKRIVYSTCSLNPRENEAVVEEVITMCPAFKLVPSGEIFQSKWNNFGGKEYGEIGRRCVYTRPEKDLTNGFFVAVFERLEEGEQNEFFIQKTFNKGNAFNEDSTTENEGVPDTSKPENNKKEKKKLSETIPNGELNDKTDNLDEFKLRKERKKKEHGNDIEETAEAKQDSVEKKKNKKHKHSKTDSTHASDDTKKEEMDNLDEVSNENNAIPKKNKKCKRHGKENGLDGTNFETINNEVEHLPKKKKKSKVEEAEFCAITSTNDQINQKEEHVSKKKKKFNHENDIKTDDTNMGVATNEEIEEHIPKKKKKKSKKENVEEESCSITPNDQVNQEEVHILMKIKKSKHEKKNNTDESRTEVEEHIPKKKKKKSKIENEDEKSFDEKHSSFDELVNKTRKIKKHHKDVDIKNVKNESAVNDVEEEVQSKKRKRKHDEESNVAGDGANAEKKSKKRKKTES